MTFCKYLLISDVLNELNLKKNKINEIKYNKLIRICYRSRDKLSERYYTTCIRG